MAHKPSVTIIGPGSLGGALAVELYRAGFPISEIVFRHNQSRARTIARTCGSRAATFEAAKLVADIIWICVPDASISKVARSFRERTEWRGKTVFHPSGALASDELRPLKQRGASVASVHPMMSFVRASQGTFQGVSFALEGDLAAVKQAAEIARTLKGTSFKLKKKDKALYHALGAFSSPLLIAQVAAAEKIGRRLGLSTHQTRGVVGPILQKTLQNYLHHGTAAAFSGPLVRGDVGTIRQHLTALARVPGMAEIYRALAKVAIDQLPVKKKAEIRRLLG
jgi:predicted short-subunit dehydrogenase-like oxidoreductase (DUF2520 family)